MSRPSLDRIPEHLGDLTPSRARTLVANAVQRHDEEIERLLSVVGRQNVILEDLRRKVNILEAGLTTATGDQG